jgi:hypothetical protein
MRGALKRVAVAIILGATLLYLIDYAILRYRIATNRNAYGTVTVKPYYAVPRKDHKTEFLFGDPQDQTCVHSLFPHFGDSPCWYLSRHTQPRVDM